WRRWRSGGGGPRSWWVPATGSTTRSSTRTSSVTGGSASVSPSTPGTSRWLRSTPAFTGSRPRTAWRTGWLAPRMTSSSTSRPTGACPATSASRAGPGSPPTMRSAPSSRRWHRSASPGSWERCTTSTHPVGSGTAPPHLAVTSDRLVLVRFHGRNYDTWYRKVATTGERFDYLYPPSELEQWVPAIQAAADRGVPVHVLMNNNRSNYAVVNGFDMAHLLGVRTPRPPAPILRRMEARDRDLRDPAGCAARCRSPVFQEHRGLAARVAGLPIDRGGNCDGHGVPPAQ